MMASAPCPTMDLLIEIGPPADLSVEMLENLSQPPVVGTLNENGTPSSVSACLPMRQFSQSAGVGEGLGCGVAEGEGAFSAVFLSAPVAACRAAGGTASCSPLSASRVPTSP